MLTCGVPILQVGGVRNSFYIILVLFLQSVSHFCLWKFHKLVFLFIPYILDHSNVSYCQLITPLFYFLLSPLVDFVTSCSVCGNLEKNLLIIVCLIFLFLLLTAINILKLCTSDQLCPFLKLMGWPRH